MGLRVRIDVNGDEIYRIGIRNIGVHGDDVAEYEWMCLNAETAHCAKGDGLYHYKPDGALKLIQTVLGLAMREE